MHQGLALGRDQTAAAIDQLLRGGAIALAEFIGAARNKSGQRCRRE
jgi:hypothetical protein